MVRESVTRAGLAATLVLVASTAQATLLTQTRSYDLTSPLFTGSGGNADVLLFDRFDPALGTLSTVDITIAGTLHLNGAFPSSFTSNGPFGIVPVPYTYTMSIEQDFGVGWFGPHTLIFTGNLGGGTSVVPFDFTTTYTHSFTYTAMTDLVGLAPVATTSSTLGAPLQGLADIPPSFVGGTRDDFVSPVPSVLLPWLATPEYSDTVVETGVSGQVAGTIRMSGTMTATYDFIEAAPVPEPSGLSLFVAGLFGAAVTRRRRG